MDNYGTLYYTDGHEVTITDSGFKVRNTLYKLSGITRHGFSIVAPHRAPCIALLISGLAIFICGAFNILPGSWSQNVTVFGFTLVINGVVMTIGTVLFGLGTMILLRLREKYAVRIQTSEGEKLVVVSHSREYINQIIGALNRAFLDLVKTRTRASIV
jgi:hypothetical protein